MKNLDFGVIPNDYNGNLEVSSESFDKAYKAMKGKAFTMEFNSHKFACKLTTRRGNVFYIKGKSLDGLDKRTNYIHWDKK